MTTPQVLVTQSATADIIEVHVPGPQGPSGDTGLPTGGDPGDILMKDGYANGQAEWMPTLDGGTFN